MKLAAAYVRVSTEEQAMRGYSIDAQWDALRKYARENDYLIVAEYSDEGVSGKKPYNKRPALSRFMEDIQNGVKVDVLLFCKLDRFYRSVKLYYQAVEIMDRYGVAWKAILEDYETETANGRLKVNLMLAIAENEADRTSERIKFVFENKIAKGQVVSGKVPIGYKIENHKYVIDPEKAEIVRVLFKKYAETHSAAATIRYLQDHYNMDMPAQSMFWILRNHSYIGFYRGNPNFCEPIIPEDEFIRMQELLKSRSVRHNQNGQVYIFSGLLICADCGRRMSGSRCLSGRTGNLYLYYRCNMQYLHPRICARTKRIRETYLENWLLENIGAELEAQRLEANAKSKTREQKRKGPDRASIMRKLSRLKDLYVNELIDLEQYREDYTRYTDLLAELNDTEMNAANKPKTPDFQKLREKIAGIQTYYHDLDVTERQSLWREIIQEIHVDLDNKLRIFFK